MYRGDVKWFKYLGKNITLAKCILLEMILFYLNNMHAASFWTLWGGGGDRLIQKWQAEKQGKWTTFSLKNPENPNPIIFNSIFNMVPLKCVCVCVGVGGWGVRILKRLLKSYWARPNIIMQTSSNNVGSKLLKLWPQTNTVPQSLPLRF